MEVRFSGLNALSKMDGITFPFVADSAASNALLAQAVFTLDLTAFVASAAPREDERFNRRVSKYFRIEASFIGITSNTTRDTQQIGG